LAVWIISVVCVEIFCFYLTVHPSRASSQPDFQPFRVSCDQHPVNSVQPQPGVY